jgi:ABC-type lipoprotein release transport system permease subunit
MTRSATTAKVKKDNAPESNTNVYILGWGEGKHSHMKWGDDFSNDTIAISEKIADETGAKVGDTISFTYGASDLRGPVL